MEVLDLNSSRPLIEQLFELPPLTPKYPPRWLYIITILSGLILTLGLCLFFLWPSTIVIEPLCEGSLGDFTGLQTLTQAAGLNTWGSVTRFPERGNFLLTVEGNPVRQAVTYKLENGLYVRDQESTLGVTNPFIINSLMDVDPSGVYTGFSASFLNHVKIISYAKIPGSLAQFSLRQEFTYTPSVLYRYNMVGQEIRVDPVFPSYLYIMINAGLTELCTIGDTTFQGRILILQRGSQDLSLKAVIEPEESSPQFARNFTLQDQDLWVGLKTSDPSIPGGLDYEGAVAHYTRTLDNPTTWTLLEIIAPPADFKGAAVSFGLALTAVSDQVMISSALGVLIRQGSNWSLLEQDTPNFGKSLVVQGNYLFINSDSKIYIYQWDQTWTLLESLESNSNFSEDQISTLSLSALVDGQITVMTGRGGTTSLEPTIRLFRGSCLS